MFGIYLDTKWIVVDEQLIVGIVHGKASYNEEHYFVKRHSFEYIQKSCDGCAV